MSKIATSLLALSCILLFGCEIDDTFKHPISEHCAGGYVFILYRDGVYDPVLIQLKDKEGNGIPCHKEATCQKN